MYCMHCGTQNPDSARFCNNCGKPMNSAPAAKKPSKQKSSVSDLEVFLSILLPIVVIGLVVNFGVDAIWGLFSGKDRAQKKTSPDTSWVTEAQPEPEPGYMEYLDGTWESVTLRDGKSSLNVSALVFSRTVYDCTSFTVNMDVTMNAGTSCKDWNVWVRSGGSFVKVGKAHLPEGNGFGYQTLYFDTPITFDAVAVTPTAVGGYSWSMALSITDILTK